MWSICSIATIGFDRHMFVNHKPVCCTSVALPPGEVRYGNVDLNTSSLKMYWNVAKQFGGQELWRELLQVSMLAVSGEH